MKNTRTFPHEPQSVPAARRFATFEELRRYCYHVASAVGLICAEIFGVIVLSRDLLSLVGMAGRVIDVLDIRNGVDDAGGRSVRAFA